MTQLVSFVDQFVKGNSAPGKNYTPPEFEKDAFDCPHCKAYAHQKWDTLCLNEADEIACVNGESQSVIIASICQCCDHLCLWVEEKMIYPNMGNAPLPNKDLPSDVKKIYDEAASIMLKSPRAAAGLLRLAIETLCIELKCDGKNLHDMINSLAKKDSGLQKVVTALNVVRLVGNKSAHAGTIRINENPKIVEGMFTLINYAADRLITAPQTQETIIDNATKLLENTENKESE